MCNRGLLQGFENVAEAYGDARDFGEGLVLRLAEQNDPYYLRWRRCRLEQARRDIEYRDRVRETVRSEDIDRFDQCLRLYGDAIVVNMHMFGVYAEEA